jgi:4-amino-4-deoxy-L-arabinose transferase-like glycosyltransferase
MHKDAFKAWLKSGTHFWYLLVLSLFLFLFKASSLPIIDGDTFYYISHAKKILLTNDWLNTSSLMSKPPLVLWLWALTYKLLGVSLFSTQLWHSAFSFLLIWGTYKFAEKLYDNKTAFISSIVLLTSFQMFYMARLPMLDMTFTVFLTGAFYFFYEFYTGRKNKDLYLTCLLLGLAFINKGLIAFSIPFIVIIPFCAFNRNFIFFKKKEDIKKDVFTLLLALGVLLLAVSPWLLPQFLAFRHRFINLFWLENIVRFFHPIDGGTAKPQTDFYMYFIYLVIGFFPWSGFIFPALIKKTKEAFKNKDPKLLFLLCWIIFPFILFSISGHWKVPRYIFPIYPAVAILIGIKWQNILANKNEQSRSSVFLSFLFAMPILLLALAAHFIAFPAESAILKPFLFSFLGLLFLAILFGNIFLIKKNYVTAFSSFLVYTLLAYLFFLTQGAAIFPKLLPEKTFCEQVTKATSPRKKIAVWNMPVRSINFYLDRNIQHFSRYNNLKAFITKNKEPLVIFANAEEQKEILDKLAEKWEVKAVNQNLVLIKFK